EKEIITVMEASDVDELPRINSDNNTDQVAAKLSALNLGNNKENQPIDKVLQAKFNKLISKGKELIKEYDYKTALKLFEKAYSIQSSDKLYRRIQRLKEAIAEDDNESNDTDEVATSIDIGNGCILERELYNHLYDYQRDGVAWLWRIYKDKDGGILADDMGLGKTLQSITFITALSNEKKRAAIIIVVPLSLMENWEAEFKKWNPQIRVGKFHGSNKQARDITKNNIQNRGGILLTTYGLIAASNSLSKDKYGHVFVWDVILLDEGHKIKNSTKTSKMLREIRSRRRIVLTGTPIQNNLKELWSLLDYVCQGKLLGSLKTFQMQYEAPIVRGREKDATDDERHLGNSMSESLQKLIKPYILRRTKAIMKAREKQPTKPDHAFQDSCSNPSQTICSREPPTLMRKNDFVIWLPLSKTQIKIYKDFLTLDRVKNVLMSSHSPLTELTVLKKICDHPRLLSSHACSELGLEEDDDDEVVEYKDFARSLPAIRVLLEEAGKLQLLADLLENFEINGHRCLIFSQSRKMLNIIQKVVTERGYKMLRIDGTVTKPGRRMELVQEFQTNSSYLCFLLTTQVGGVGLNLTAADRVIIFDPSWNPATDAQAVDRVYRIGQSHNVIIYRLITCGTVEEKIYRRQIFKYSIINQTTGSTKDPFRYFSKQELYDMFALDSPHVSNTQVQLEKMHASERKTDPDLEAHIKFLKTLGIFGISDHDLMFSKEEKTRSMVDESSQEYIKARIQNAQRAITAESDMVKNTGLVTALGITSFPSIVPKFGQSEKKSQQKSRTAKASKQMESVKFCLPDSELFVPSKSDKKNNTIQHIPSVSRILEKKNITINKVISSETQYKSKKLDLQDVASTNVHETTEEDYSEAITKTLSEISLTDNKNIKQNSDDNVVENGFIFAEYKEMHMHNPVESESEESIALLETNCGNEDDSVSPCNKSQKDCRKEAATGSNFNEKLSSPSNFEDVTRKTSLIPKTLLNNEQEIPMNRSHNTKMSVNSSTLSVDSNSSGNDKSCSSEFFDCECNSPDLKESEVLNYSKTTAQKSNSYYNERENKWFTLSEACDNLQSNHEDLEAQLQLLKVANEVGLSIRNDNGGNSR
ncbi:DNA excision repair protein ERCC-6-like, partial [Trichoplax sp. H2]